MLDNDHYSSTLQVQGRLTNQQASALLALCQRIAGCKSNDVQIAADEVEMLIDSVRALEKVLLASGAATR